MGTSPKPASVTPVEAIRACFPALDRVHNDHPVAYFDGAGGTHIPGRVVEAIGDYLYHHDANTHWAVPTSSETDSTIRNGRAAWADFLNASPAQIIIGPNMTTLTFHLSRALGRSYGPGDEIVVTELDHHANVAPWRALVQELGITVHSVRMVPRAGRLVEGVREISRQGQ